jgi:hypothetical protein
VDKAAFFAITQICRKGGGLNPRKTIPSFRSTSRNLEPRKVICQL